MTIPHYDVVIAGSGPAGCAAAIRLRQLNLSVCIVDNANDNALKVGESLPGAAIRLLNRLGIKNMSQLLPQSAYSPCIANVSAWGMDDWTYNDAIKNPENGGWHILRHKFDKSLRQLASQNEVTFYNAKFGKTTSTRQKNDTNEINHSISFKTKDTALPETISSRWIIDATGRASAVIKQFGIDRLAFEQQIAAIVWLKPSTKKNQDSTTRIKSVENGWWYSAKLPDNTRVVSFHGLPNDIAKMVKSKTLFVSEANKVNILIDSIAENEILEGVIARNAGFFKASDVIGKSWLAIGDAALSLDPISSQGMFFALYSGVRGAETIASVINDSNDCSGIRDAYRQKVENVFIANANSRKHYYTTEQRYASHPYWKQYLNSV